VCPEGLIYLSFQMRAVRVILAGLHALCWDWVPLLERYTHVQCWCCWLPLLVVHPEPCQEPIVLLHFSTVDVASGSLSSIVCTCCLLSCSSFKVLVGVVGIVSWSDSNDPLFEQTALRLVKNPDLPNFMDFQPAMDAAGVPLRTTEPVQPQIAFCLPLALSS
jgi:hypothetical protein